MTKKLEEVKAFLTANTVNSPKIERKEDEMLDVFKHIQEALDDYKDPGLEALTEEANEVFQFLQSEIPDSSWIEVIIGCNLDHNAVLMNLLLKKRLSEHQANFPEVYEKFKASL